jgi:hypothetical protein
MNLYQKHVISLAACSMLLACSGGGDAEATADTTSGTASTPSAADPAAPAPAACTAEPIGATGYSLVFKGCDAANVATYYDKSECVRDNATGLIWQGQTPAGTGLRANDGWAGTNYNDTSVAQKWNGVTYVNPTQADIDSSTNTTGFKNAINATNLCGFNDWRLPSKDELFGLVKPALSPKIDTTWFVNFSTTTFYQRFWTNTQSGNPNRWAFSIYFDSGTAEPGNTRETFIALRLVR